MGRHWARQEAKRNDLEEFLVRIIAWIKRNRQTAALVAGGIVIAGFVALIYSYRSQTLRNAAWSRVDLAEAYFYRGNKNEALKQIQETSDAYPGQPATGFGLLLAGDSLYAGGLYKESEPYYKQLIDRGNPQKLLPFALSGLARAQEAAGDYSGAVQSAQTFLNLYAEHFLAPQAHWTLARSLEKEGKIDEAKATYQKISLQYPDTSFAALAAAKLNHSKR